MRIIIAGASGFIGGNLSSYLADEGFDIVAICYKNKPNDLEWEGKMFRVLEMDVTSYNSMPDLDEFNADAIINLVSLNQYDSNNDPDIISKVNINPTWNFLDYFSKRGLKKYIYLSTIHIYGHDLTDDITELSPTLPKNQYGLTHLISEQITDYFHRTTDVDSYNIRLSNGFGSPKFTNNDCWELVVNNLCLSAWESGSLILNSDGTPLRDFFHIENLSLGIKKLLLGDKNPVTKNLNTINFSSGVTISMLDAAIIVRDVYEEIYNKSLNIYINKKQWLTEFKMSCSANYSINNDLYLKLVQGDKIIDFKSGIKKVFNFLEKSVSK